MGSLKKRKSKWDLFLQNIFPTDINSDSFAASTTRKHSEMEAWMDAMELVSHCSKLIRKFPKEEKYDLCFKIRQCAYRIPGYIAKAMRRYDRYTYFQNMNAAYANLMWLETDLELAEALGYITKEKIRLYIEHSKYVSGILNDLISQSRNRLTEKQIFSPVH